MPVLIFTIENGLDNVENWILSFGLALATVGAGLIVQRFILTPLWRMGNRATEPDDSRPATPPPDSTPPWRLIYSGLLLVMLVLSALAFNTGFDASEDESTRADFPTASGVIIRSEAVENVRDTDMSLVGDVVDSKYNLYIEYAYTVDGLEYTGQRVVFDERLSGDDRLLERSVAEDYVETYPPDSEVTVIYDPDDPSRAGLELQEGSAAPGIAWAGGALFGVLGGVLFLPLILKAE